MWSGTNKGGTLIQTIQTVCQAACDVWWHTPIIPTLGRLREEGPHFKASLSYMLRLSQKTNKKTKATKKFLASNLVKFEQKL
jgi:hypothetical protein